MKFFRDEESTKEAIRLKAPGAKNALLPLMYAAAACDTPTILRNAPLELGDFGNTVSTLRSIGIDVRTGNDTVDIAPERPTFGRLDSETAQRTRYSSLLLGLGAARGRKIMVPHPGGCRLGRKLDIHIEGLRALGHKVEEDSDGVALAPGKRWNGGYRLRTPSVGATLNFMIAATGADRPVVLENVAIEPEVLDVADFLSERTKITMGPDRMMEIFPGPRKGRDWTVRPDRIAVGSYLIAGLLLEREVAVEGILPSDLTAALDLLARIGVDIKIDGTTAKLRNPRLRDLRPFTVTTDPHPGFPTDLQPLMAALGARINGANLIEERVYDNRFQYSSTLRDLGAKVYLGDHELCVLGSAAQPIRGADVSFACTDIRGGMACLLYAMSTGASTVSVDRFFEVERGYGNASQLIGKFGYRAEGAACALS